MTTVLQQLNTEMASVVENVGRGLVQIRSSGGGSGAGTIWHPDGLILTNAHGVRRGPLQITLPDGHTLPARLLAHDRDRDLAALAVDASGLPAMDLGESKLLRPGQLVLALGHPWGIVGALTAGVVIGMGSEGQVPPGDWIIANLHLRPGYSGGPLIDIHGHLVGINAMMTGPDVGIAVPVHVAKAFLRQTLGSQRTGDPD